jgi:hypothetical protein
VTLPYVSTVTLYFFVGSICFVIDGEITDFKSILVEFTNNVFDVNRDVTKVAAGPCIPVGPAGPWGPVGPVGPWGPTGPGLPAEPGNKNLHGLTKLQR